MKPDGGGCVCRGEAVIVRGCWYITGDRLYFFLIPDPYEPNLSQ